MRASSINNKTSRSERTSRRRRRRMHDEHGHQAEDEKEERERERMHWTDGELHLLSGTFFLMQQLNKVPTVHSSERS